MPEIVKKLVKLLLVATWFYFLQELPALICLKIIKSGGSIQSLCKAMNKIIVVYYTSLKGDSPVSDFLDSLNYKQQTKLLRIIKYVEIYGLQSILPHKKIIRDTVVGNANLG